MEEQARAAFIMSQVVMMQCELEAMKVANIERLDKGYALAYDESAFDELRNRYHCLEYNEVLNYL